MSYEERKKELGPDDNSERLNINLLRYLWEASPLYFKESYHTYFRNLSILKSFSDNDIRIFTKYLHRREFEANELIFKYGDSGYGFYFIHSGSVSIQEPNGAEIVNLGEKNFFGELALLEEGHRRPASAVASGPTVLLGVFKPDVEKMLESHPILGAKFIHEAAVILASKVGHMTREIMTLRRKIELLEKKN
ncbi:MAG: cyclic nucleotide-binding domain-containing protein [Bacteriovoracaceae bacterium]